MTLRLSLIIAAVVLVLSAGLYVRHLQHEVKVQTERAEGAAKSEQLTKATTNVTERFHEKETIIREQAETSAHAVEELPSDAVPGDVLAAWRNGVRNVHASPDDQRSNQPTPAVR